MDAEALAEKIETVNQRVAQLTQQAVGLPEPYRELLGGACVELDGILEELRVAEQEIYEQQARLEDAHRQTEAERQRYQDRFDSMPDADLATTETLRLYANRLSIMREIDRAILAACSPVEIARAALYRLRQLVPCQRGGVMVIGPTGLRAVALIVDSQGEFRVDAGVQLPPELFDWDETSAAAKMLPGEDFATEPLICNDPPPIVRTFLADGVRSYMALPLVSQGILIGALSLGAGQEYAFTSAHLDIAREVADSVAIAIQHAHLNEQIDVGRERLRSLTRRLVEHQEIERFLSNGHHSASPEAPKHVVLGYIHRRSARSAERLTPRQREILQLIAEGTTIKESAQKLNISVKTVEMHRTQLMERLGIHDVAGLVRYAIRIGLVTPEE